MKILALGFSFLASRWPARPETSRRAMSLREPQTRASVASRNLRLICPSTAPYGRLLRAPFVSLNGLMWPAEGSERLFFLRVDGLP